MIPSDLDELERLACACRSGEWFVQDAWPESEFEVWERDGNAATGEGDFYLGVLPARQTADFLVACHRLVPQLIAEVRKRPTVRRSTSVRPPLVLPED